MSDAPTHTGARAVFLSYAREDAEAARRIADALRAFGIEVWFDQNELRGGDQWDSKIRGQIKACTLFIPVISQRTEARTEGYFRREWKLAVDRTHDMAGGVAFIVPVAIDDTPEGGAAVPEEFARYHWTRLLGGTPSPDFVAQVKRLLEAPRKPALKSEQVRPPTLPAHLKEATRAREAAASAPAKKSRAGLTFGAAFAIVVAIATAVYVGRKPAPPAPAGEQPRPAATPTAPVPASQAPVAPAVNPKSIAVLPFANLSPDASNAFFADGMHDEVITALAKVRDLTVISRTSVLPYRKSEERNLRKIAAELGVANVLEGSVQRAGDRVKVIVQLIRATEDRHLWAETYVENVTDVFSIQSKLAGAITAALKATLSPEEQSLIATRPTNNPEAYDAYLAARTMAAVIAPGSGRASYDALIQQLEKAVTLDPGFTRARAELCYQNGIMYWFAVLDATPARRARAKAELDQLLAQGRDLPETHVALGTYLYTCENDWAGAYAELTAAEARLPNDALLAYLRGLSLRRLGRIGESLSAMDRAITLSPQDVNYRVQYNLSLLSLHRYEDWQKATAESLRRFPGNWNFLMADASARLQLDGDLAAFLQRQEALPLPEDDPHGLLKAYRVAGYRGDLAAAEKILSDPRLTQLSGVSAITLVPVSLHRALVANLQGRTAEARRWAETARTELQAMTANRRQESWQMLNLATAEALAGRGDEAVRLAREGADLTAARDAFSAGRAKLEAATVLLILRRDAEALALARDAFTLPSEIVPALLRRDLVWTRLNGDPRFEELLRSIKSL